MNKKFCIVVIALIALCMATSAVFAAQPTSCPSHHTRWRDGCNDCRIAQNNIQENREARRAAEKRLRKQKERLAQLEQKKAEAATDAEANEIEKEMKKVTITVYQLEVELRDLD